MPYIPVDRTITIEFRPDLRRRSRFEVVVTDHEQEVRYGDTIVWVPQGLPARAVVTVGNFLYLGDHGALLFRRGRVRAMKPRAIPDAAVHLRGGKPTLHTQGYDLGVYKYDVLVNGVVVKDPEFEIKGPRGG
jgi:hypothetical protein